MHENNLTATDPATRRTARGTNQLLPGFALAVLGGVAAIGTLLPIAAKGAQGVTILYLSGFAHIFPVTAMPLVLFLIAPGAIAIGLLLASGRLRTPRPWFLVLGLLGMLFASLGIMEGIEHIRAFINGCSALNFAADDTSPIGIGRGGMLSVAGYGGMVLGGLLPAYNRRAGGIRRQIADAHAS
jgi:hypothetical protein